MKHVISKELAEELVKDCDSIADFCRKVGWKPVAGNYRVFHTYVKDYNLDTSHFKGQAWRFDCDPSQCKRKTSEDLMKEKKNIKGPLLIKKLIEEGKKERKCERCGNDTWEGSQIPLELHHIDGDRTNNSFENLQLLCPNCHALTDNYRVKKNVRRCSICGKPLKYKNDSGLCRECYDKTLRTKKRPEKEILEDLSNTMTNIEIAKIYDVSETAVRKWKKIYNI